MNTEVNPNNINVDVHMQQLQVNLRPSVALLAVARTLSCPGEKFAFVLWLHKTDLQYCARAAAAAAAVAFCLQPLLLVSNDNWTSSLGCVEICKI